MKRYLSVCLMASSMLVAASAYAAPVFMLQFGSFESREEAETKLNDLKVKHAGVLSRLQLGVREVKLPPDNITSYRTQAGPLATRADAQSVCSQLASNGDECYVVETAMETSPGLAPSTQVAAAAPAAIPPVPAPVAAPAPMPAAVPPVPPAPMPPLPSVTPAPMAAMAPSGAMAVRDPQNVAAINSVTAPALVESSGMTSADTAADMDRALAKAAAKQPTLQAQPSPFNDSAVGESPATTATHIAEDNARTGQTDTTPKPPARSLWDRLFGSDDDTVKTAAVAAPVAVSADDEMRAAPPIEPVTTVPSPAPVAAAAPAPMLMPPPHVAVVAAQPIPQPMPVAPAPQPMATPPAPQPVMAPPAAAPVAVASPVMTAPVMTQAASFPLPPPPAPLVGHDAPTAVPMPMAAAPGSVHVEEAKRVPLSQAPMPQPMPVTATPLAPPAAMPTAAAPALPAMLSPSATIGQKTLWAEVGSFPDNQSALAYWEQYRRTNPDFPVVRVRVASSVMQQRHGNGDVNLRIGPFSRESTIEHLCETMPNQDETLRCGPVTDMGVASAPQPGTLPASRYAH